MPHIYKITSPSNKIYVGSSVNIKRRFKRYRCLDTKGQPKLHNSLIKYGVNNHIFEIICECEELDMYKLENHYADKYCVLGANGLNCQLPKSDDLPCRFSDETRLRMSIAGKKIITTPETKIKQREAAFKSNNKRGTGIKHTAEFCKNISIRNIGNTYNLGKKASDTAIENRKISIQKRKENGTYICTAGKLIINIDTGVFHESLKEAYATYPSINIRWKYKYVMNMIEGYKNNKTFLIYA